MVYLPPYVPLRSNRRFFQLLHTCSLDYNHKTIMVDWNAAMTDKNKTEVRFKRRLESELSLKLINTGPSHHTENNDSWIDLLYIDVFKTVSPSSSYTFRGYSKMFSEEINMHLQECDWSVFSHSVSDLNIEQGLSTLTI